jgi:hypothetical protein
MNLIEVKSQKHCFPFNFGLDVGFEFVTIFEIYQCKLNLLSIIGTTLGLQNLIFIAPIAIYSVFTWIILINYRLQL